MKFPWRHKPSASSPQENEYFSRLIQHQPHQLIVAGIGEVVSQCYVGIWNRQCLGAERLNPIADGLKSGMASLPLSMESPQAYGHLPGTQFLTPPLLESA